jgi:hypothetical protein
MLAGLPIRDQDLIIRPMKDELADYAAVSKLPAGTTCLSLLLSARCVLCHFFSFAANRDGRKCDFLAPRSSILRDCADATGGVDAQANTLKTRSTFPTRRRKQAFPGISSQPLTLPLTHGDQLAQGIRTEVEGMPKRSVWTATEVATQTSFRELYVLLAQEAVKTGTVAATQGEFRAVAKKHVAVPAKQRSDLADFSDIHQCGAVDTNKSRCVELVLDARHRFAYEMRPFSQMEPDIVFVRLNPL